MIDECIAGQLRLRFMNTDPVARHRAKRRWDRRLGRVFDFNSEPGYDLQSVLT